MNTKKYVSTALIVLALAIPSFAQTAKLNELEARRGRELASNINKTAVEITNAQKTLALRQSKVTPSATSSRNLVMKNQADAASRRLDYLKAVQTKNQADLVEWQSQVLSNHKAAKTATIDWTKGEIH